VPIGSNLGYLGNGANDYAIINDFDLFSDSIDLGRFRNYSFATEASGTVNLFSGKDVNNRDLIAKIQLANSGTALNQKAKSASAMGVGATSMLAKASGLGIDSGITAQINILSGDSSIADTI
jgi:hypothetical protein